MTRSVRKSWWYLSFKLRICIIQPLREMRGKGGLLEILTYPGWQGVFLRFLILHFFNQTKECKTNNCTKPSTWYEYFQDIPTIFLLFSTSINDGRYGKLHYNSILLSLSILLTIFTIVDGRFMKKKCLLILLYKYSWC